jgi:DNA-binding Lrp family transcriptional regulator
MSSAIFACLKNGRIEVKCNTLIIDENVKKVEKMVMNDHRITIREVADEVGISIGSCHNIVSYVLGMKRVAAKSNPKPLNFVVACS